MRKSRTPVLDDLDAKILERYQPDTRLPARAIGEAVGLSTAAVQRRLQRLREAGVIEREVAQVAPKAVGFPVTCLVAVELEREGGDHTARFRKRIAAFPEVQQCYGITGPADFFLVVLAADMEAYDAFTRRALLSDENVRSFTTHVVLDRVKVGVDVPLGAARRGR
ncbi:MAG TPA: Lrp/AsnC family transcriptional regulator [Thermoanaerobaculia bacterium]|jgi:DNA-binding Lrp family transcriptional regulator|nr:Lrp/AsnC family transcriptional regulator [Thermoanaerobaculia bacterium]